MKRIDPLVSVFILIIDLSLFFIFSTIIWRSRSNMIEISNTLTSDKMLSFSLPLVMIAVLSILFLLLMFKANKMIFRIFDFDKN